MPVLFRYSMFLFSPSSSRLSSFKKGVIMAGNTPLNINLHLAPPGTSLAHHIGDVSCHAIAYGLILDIGILRYLEFIGLKVRAKGILVRSQQVHGEILDVTRLYASHNQHSS
jgi:hypothetical protein